MPDLLIEDGVLPSILPPVDVRIILDSEIYGREQHIVSGTGKTYRSSLPSNYRDDLLDGIDIYFGMAMSGSFMHTHGTAVASSSGKKLWILYSPEMQCKLATPAGARMFTNANLPPLCDESDPLTFNIKNKHHPNASLCLGHLHPLEMLRKMLDLEEEARPEVAMTGPGDVLVIPERWMHMTINLENSYTVSYRYRPSWPPHLGCP